MPAEEPKIFFSYARADADFVLRLAKDLRAAGTNLWVDQLDIRPGDRWDSAVEQALNACPCLLVILSPASVASQNVMDEVSAALEANKRIVPVRYLDSEIPFRLKRLQYIDFRADYDSGLSQLLNALNVVQPASTPQPREAQRPQGMQNNNAERMPAETGAKRGETGSSAHSAATLISTTVSDAGMNPGTGFWRSLPGILTSAAAVIAAVSGLIFVWHIPSQKETNPTAPKPSTPAAVAKVYMHTSEERDRAVLEEIGNALRAKGYEVPDTRLSSVKTAGDVRFFFPQDRDHAGRLKSAVESELRTRGYQISLELLERDGAKFQYAAPGKMEVWLPPLAKNTGTR